MTAHAKLGPSSAKRWMNCPGSVALCVGLPDTTSEHSELGTAGHELGEHCLAEGVDAADCRGMTFNRHTVDSDMIAAVQDYLDLVRELLAIVRPGELHVVDYKHGAGVFVAIDMNEQLLCYAAGAVNGAEPFRVGARLSIEERVIVTDDVWGTADAVILGPGEVEHVFYHIVQPRHRLGGHHVAQITIDELTDWRDDILTPAAEATKDPDAILCAGEWCRWCKAKPTCPKLRETALTAASSVFVGDPAEMSTDVAGLNVARLSPVELSKALAAVPAVEQWIKAIKDHAYDQARNGVKIPGRKIVDITGHRAWDDPDLVVLAAEAHDVDPYEPRKLRSPAAMSKAMPKGHKKTLDVLASKPITGTALVPDSDKRPAKNAAAVFDEITEAS